MTLIKYSNKRGVSVFELLVTCAVLVTLVSLVLKAYQDDVVAKKRASIKSNLVQLHQGAIQMSKKYEFTELETHIKSNSNIKDCFDEIGTNCDILASLNPKLHTGATLTALQKEENALLNGGFNLDGTICTAPNPDNCQIRNLVTLSFDCNSTKCLQGVFSVSTSINLDKINNTEKVDLAAIPPFTSTLIHDKTKEGQMSRNISSCAGNSGFFGFNPSNGQPLCDVNSLNNKTLFDPNFAQMMSSTTLLLSGGGVGPPDPNINPSCPAGYFLVKINDDKTLLCEKALMNTCGAVKEEWITVFEENFDTLNPAIWSDRSWTNKKPYIQNGKLVFDRCWNNSAPAVFASGWPYSSKMRVSVTSFYGSATGDGQGTQVFGPCMNRHLQAGTWAGNVTINHVAESAPNCTDRTASSIWVGYTKKAGSSYTPFFANYDGVYMRVDKIKVECFKTKETLNGFDDDCNGVIDDVCN